MVCAGVLTYALVTVRPGGPRSQAFIDSTNYVVWRLLIVVLVLVTLVSAAVGWPRFAKLRRKYPTADVRPLALVYPIPVLVTAALPWLTQPSVSVAWSLLSVRLGIVVLVVAAGIAPAVGTVWIVRRRLGEMAETPQDDAENDTATRIVELSTLRRTAGAALGVLAGIISLTVVNTSQLRRTYLDAGAPPEILPAIGVVLYGSFLAGLLALLYVPAHFRWRDSAEAVRDRLYPIPTDGRPDADWSDGRKRVSDLLELDRGVPGILGTALTVAAPFLISLLGWVIPAPA